jgi:hypothetical protein
MPRGKIDKPEMLAKVYRLKSMLYDGDYKHQNNDWHNGSHDSLNKVLDILNEYSQ